jgi:hypothetical protein
MNDLDEAIAKSLDTFTWIEAAKADGVPLGGPVSDPGPRAPVTPPNATKPAASPPTASKPTRHETAWAAVHRHVQTLLADGEYKTAQQALGDARLTPYIERAFPAGGASAPADAEE